MKNCYCSQVSRNNRWECKMTRRPFSYKRFFDLAPCGFYQTDIQTGQFLKANEFMAHFLGYNNTEELLERKSTDFYSAEKRESLIEKIKEDGIVLDLEVEVTLLTGSKKWAILTCRVCEDGDCLEGSIIDITYRKKIQMELDTYKEKDIEMLKGIQYSVQDRLKSYE